MTSFAFGASNSGSTLGVRADLSGMFDGAYIGSGAVIGSSNASVVVGYFSYHVVTVDGVAAGAGYGIYLGDDGTNDTHERVTIGSEGEVYGYAGFGVYVNAYSSAIINAGYVYGDNGAVYMGGVSATTYSSLTNTGTLEGRQYGVYHSGTEAFIFKNSGSVVGEMLSCFNDGEGSARVTNTGHMTGAIYLGAGNDLYDGASGRHATGEIRGDDGNDTIRGGADNDTIRGGNNNDSLGGGAGNDAIDGGAGIDTLNGGLGNDRLWGGTEKDYFRFTTKLGSTNIDTIISFNHTDDAIQLDDVIFKTLGTSVTVGEFYAAAGAVKAHDVDDRIIYNTTTHKLYFDDDGNKAGGHAAVQFALLSSPSGTLAYNDFTII